MDSRVKGVTFAAFQEQKANGEFEEFNLQKEEALARLFLQ